VTASERIPVVILLGPTAVGKTEVSIRLAERLQAEIISADSRLFYRGMDIGTAKPTRDIRARVPHHLVDVTSVDRPWSLAQFLREARRAIADVHSRGGLPLVVGGTGQYLRALVEGWRPPPKAEDRRFRREMRAFAAAQGSEALHARLAVIDPQAAERIQHQNVRRVIRALEIHYVTGEPPSIAQRKISPPYRVLQIGLYRPREELYARIDARIQDMLTAGLVSEVESLLSEGYDPSLPALSAIGYRQIIAHLRGEISLSEAVERMGRDTRQFVRRQANWFKREDEEIDWFRAEESVVDAVHARIRAWLEEEGGA
jgi:tRNA dimethylallyltransferase